MIGGFTETSILMRNSMLDVIKSDYIRTARAKGLSKEFVIFKHTLQKNALIPIAAGWKLPGCFFLPVPFDHRADVQLGMVSVCWLSISSVS